MPALTEMTERGEPNWYSDLAESGVVHIGHLEEQWEEQLVGDPSVPPLPPTGTDSLDVGLVSLGDWLTVEDHSTSWRGLEIVAEMNTL